MATDAGAIKYTVSTDTAAMLKAEAVIDKSLLNMAKSFDSADKAVKDFEATQKGLGRTVNSMGQVITANGKVVASASNDYRKLALAASQSFNTLNTKVSKSSNAVNKAMAGMGRGAGQAGIQFQQFIGQVQGGQSVMLALSQQSADLGFVLGAPLLGAVVGISASLVGMLLPALFDSGKAVDELTEKMEEWKKSIGLTQEQINFLTEEEVKANTERAKSIAGHTKEISAIKQQIANQKIALETFDLTDKARKKMLKAQDDSNKALDKAQALLQGETQAIVDSAKKIDGYNASLNKGTEETKKQQEAVAALKSTIESQLISLEQQSMALENGEEAAFRWASAQRLGMKEGELFEESVDKRITALFRLKAAQDATKQEEAETKQLTTKVQGVGLSPIEQIQSRLDAELELLRQAEEKKIEIDGSYEERRVELRKQADEQIASLNKKAAEESIVNYEALENQIIGTFASIATGAQDGKAAIQSLAQSILTQMVGALIKMGVQAIIGQTTAATTATVTGAAIAASYAPAAAMVSLASFGANSAPASAGIAATVGVSQGLALSGGRQFGGPVTNGNNYRINEAGVPEVYSSGGKDYLMNSGNGTVKQVDEIAGGGTTININNMASGIDVQATPSSDGKTIDIAVRRAVAEMTSQVSQGRGSFVSAMRSNTNMTTKATR